jgi:hypothetical protein
MTVSASEVHQWSHVEVQACGGVRAIDGKSQTARGAYHTSIPRGHGAEHAANVRVRHQSGCSQDGLEPRDPTGFEAANLLRAKRRRRAFATEMFTVAC